MRKRLLVQAILAAVSAVGADWTQFRGPAGSGTSSETGLPTSWSSRQNIVWRTKLPGPGTSSPIVVGKRVYLTCYSGYGLEPGNGEMDKLIRHLVCVEREKGRYSLDQGLQARVARIEVSARQRLRAWLQF